MFIMPGVIALIMVFSRQTQMAELYGIRDNEMGYYLAFACVIIPFSLIMDVFVLNTQEVSQSMVAASDRSILGAVDAQETCWSADNATRLPQAVVLTHRGSSRARYAGDRMKLHR